MKQPTLLRTVGAGPFNQENFKVVAAFGVDAKSGAVRITSTVHILHRDIFA